MKKLVALLLLLASPAWGQTSQTFLQYMNALPSATTPLTGAELAYIIQGGISKKVPLSNFQLPFTSLQTAPIVAPSSICSTNSFGVAFTCDLSHLLVGIGTNITGVATLTQPTSGYVLLPNMSSIYTYYSNASGWNQGTADNGGRTAGIAHYTKADGLGQGDTFAYFANVFVNGAKAGATSFLANPAGILFGGQVFAGQAGVYLQGVGDINLNDNGFDVAGAAFVSNLTRTVSTGGLGAPWIGVRLQSVGSAPVDGGFSLTGPYKIGLDLVDASYGTNQAAAVLGGNQRIYLNATNGTNNYPQNVSLGTTFAFYDTTNSCYHVVVSNQNLECLDTNGHARMLGNTPSISSCGGAGSGIIGSDIGGRITAGSTAITSCVINFATAYNSAPFCVGTSSNTAENVAVTTSTTQLTFSYTSIASLVINYHCDAPAGG